MGGARPLATGANRPEFNTARAQDFLKTVNLAEWVPGKVKAIERTKPFCLVRI